MASMSHISLMIKIKGLVRSFVDSIAYYVAFKFVVLQIWQVSKGTPMPDLVSGRLYNAV